MIMDKEQKSLMLDDIRIRINNIMDAVDNTNSQAQWVLEEILGEDVSKARIRAKELAEEEVYDLIDAMQMYCECVKESNHWDGEVHKIEFDIKKIGDTEYKDFKGVIDDLEKSICTGESCVEYWKDGVSVAELVLQVFNDYLNILCKDEDLIEYRADNNLVIPFDVLIGKRFRHLNFVVSSGECYKSVNVSYAVFSDDALLTEDINFVKKGEQWVGDDGSIAVGCYELKFAEKGERK